MSTYNVIECDTTMLETNLNKLTSAQQVIGLNYLGGLRNQIVIKNAMKIDESKLVEPTTHKSSKKNKRR
jgi:hypothetical protein